MIRRLVAILALTVALAASGPSGASAKPHHTPTTGGIATTDSDAYSPGVNYHDPATDTGGGAGAVAIAAGGGVALLIAGAAVYRRRRPAST